MIPRPSIFQDGVGVRSEAPLPEPSDRWWGAEAGVRSQPGWSPKTEPRRISRFRWKIALSGMFAAGLAIGCLVGLAIGWERRPHESGPRDQDRGS
ncbi:MAG: hypothetical protein AB7G48_17405 [Nitrospiraceae bacterium]